MATYPDIQRRAQSHIDEIIGKDRMPTLADRNSLPYINQIILETMRWHPIIPTGSCSLYFSSRFWGLI